MGDKFPPALCERAGVMGGKILRLGLLVLLLLMPAFAQESFGDTCVRNAKYCFNASKDTALDAGSFLAGLYQGVNGSIADWEKETKVQTTKFEQSKYHWIGAYGIKESDFVTSCGAPGKNELLGGFAQEGKGVLGYSKDSTAQSNANFWATVLVLTVFLFAALFCYLENREIQDLFLDKNETTKAKIVESVTRAAAPEFTAKDFLVAPSTEELFNRRVKAAWHAIEGSILGRFSGEGEDTRAKRKSHEMATNLVAGVATDVIMLLTSATVALWLTGTLIFVYLLNQWVYPIFWEGTTPCFDIWFRIFAATFWAFWIWEMIRFFLVRAIFLFALFIPRPVLRIIYIPFVGRWVATLRYAHVVVGALALAYGANLLFSGITGLGILSIAAGIAIVVLQLTIDRIFRFIGMFVIISAFQPASLPAFDVLAATAAASFLYVVLIAVSLGWSIILKATTKGLFFIFDGILSVFRTIRTVIRDAVFRASWSGQKWQEPKGELPKPGELPEDKTKLPEGSQLPQPRWSASATAPPGPWTTNEPVDWAQKSTTLAPGEDLGTKAGETASKLKKGGAEAGK